MNIKNDDQKCFQWCVLASLHPVDYTNHPERVSKYHPYENELNMNGIEYPVSLIGIERFERQNDININVYGLNEEDCSIFPKRISERDVARHHVDLLYMSHGEEGHYLLIRNFSRLVGRQMSRHHRQMHFCRRCLHGCTTEEILGKHMERCKNHNAQRVKMPEPEENIVSFKSTEKQLRLPFIIYADFESILCRNESDEQRNLEQSWTHKYQTHKACSYGMHTVSSDKRFYSKPKIHFGEDTAERFLDVIMCEANRIRKYLKHKVQMRRLSSQEWHDYQNAAKCYICNKDITNEQTKVRDHDHLTGK